MLFTDRKAISQYAVSQGIGFREDRSNNETKYLWNRIRHEIMPHILSANPDFLKSISTTAGQVRKIEGFWNENLCRIRQAIIHESEDVIFIDFRQLTSLESPSLVAWEILSPYGFTASAIRDILASVSRDSGRKFLSKTHRLIKDRDNLIITKIKNGKGTKSEYSIDLNAGPGLERNDLPVPLRIHEENIRNDFSIPVSPTIACLDRNKIGSSLILRKWRSGDTFYPLGMNRKKKLSDFFIDIKLSIPAKENTWLLCTGDKIVWVVGLRVDNRFRITGRSKRILRVEMI
jgi:tRNA(Ile)-lysidine synthase